MESKAWLNNGIFGFPGMAKKGTLSLANGVVKFQKKNGETVFEAPASSIEVNPKTFWRWNKLDLLLKMGDNAYYLSFNSPWLRGNAGMNIYGINKLDLRKQWMDAIASGTPAANPAAVQKAPDMKKSRNPLLVLLGGVVLMAVVFGLQSYLNSSSLQTTLKTILSLASIMLGIVGIITVLTGVVLCVKWFLKKL